MVTSICAIAKYENDYIAEWVRYHINLGFDHIYIYDNNEVDGERIEDAIPADLKEKISVLDVRGKKYMQKIVYNECYRTYDFDWCAFIDIDEFITFNPKSGYTNIKQFVQDRNEFDAVHLNWMCYGDNGRIKFKKGNVVDRFSKPIRPLDFIVKFDFPMNNHSKTILKKGLNIDWCHDDKDWFSTPHTPWGLNNICDSTGNKLDENTPFVKYDFSVAYLKHFITKSIEEYTIKIVRQCADCNANIYSFGKFYLYNRLSIGKLLWQNRMKKQYSLGNEYSIKSTMVFLLKTKHVKLYGFLKSLKMK